MLLLLQVDLRYHLLEMVALRTGLVVRAAGNRMLEGTYVVELGILGVALMR